MDEFAHIWPRGGRFAFSGVDGETCFDEPFVACGTEGVIGWGFELHPAITFMAEVGREHLVAEGHPEDVCFGDCWRFFAHAGGFQGAVEGVFLDRSTIVVRIFAEGAPENSYPELVPSVLGRRLGDVELFHGAGWWMAQCATAPGMRRQFAIAISYSGLDEAIARAKNGRTIDVGELVQERLEAYRELAGLDSVAGTNRRAYFKALSIQRAHVESAQDGFQGRWTAPAARQATHLWMWDTAHQSLGLQYVRMDLAEEVVRSLFSMQSPSGRVVLPFGNALPVDEGDALAQPPILAWTVWRQFESGMRTAFLAEMYPRLAACVEWFESNRKNDNGLYGWRLGELSQSARFGRGLESGMPNSPRFDGVTSITAVDLCSYIASEYYCLERMAKVLGYGDDAAAWRGRRDDIAARMNELLWDDADRFYYDLDEYGELITVKTTAGLLPLFSRIPDRDQAESLRGHIMNPMEFNTPMPLPSVSIDEKSYSARSWRGAVWPDVNVLVYYGLMAYSFFQEARDIAHRTVDEVARCYVLYGCLYECYDPSKDRAPFDLPRSRRGDPLETERVCAVDFHRTAAAYVHLVHELY